MPLLHRVRRVLGRYRDQLKRRWFPPAPTADFLDAKRRRLERVRPLLKPGLQYAETPLHFDCLSPELREQYRIDPTGNVATHGLDNIAMSIVRQYADGLILDCGAGSRATCFDNVISLEIVPYDSTDVLGVGEELPFRDNSFDAVFSLNVLEHVTNPFACAAEIVRVLKPGGRLYCVTPFLQPLHAYPHHYFNMSHEGLRQLFAQGMEIDEQKVIASGVPIWMLSWFLRSWRDGLHGSVRQEFLEMRVGDLIGDPEGYLDQPFVAQLSPEKNFELASTTALLGRKRAA